MINARYTMKNTGASNQYPELKAGFAGSTSAGFKDSRVQVDLLHNLCAFVPCSYCLCPSVPHLLLVIEDIWIP